MKNIPTERLGLHRRKLAAIALGATIGLGANVAAAQGQAAQNGQALQPPQEQQEQPVSPPQQEQPNTSPQQEQSADQQQAGQPVAPPEQQQATGLPQQGQPDVNELQQKFMEVTQRITAIQQQAIQDEAVRQKHNEFNEAMNEAVLEVSGEAKELIDEQDALRGKILGSEELKKPSAERSPEYMAEVQRYQTIEQQLAPIRQQIAHVPAVLEKQKEFEEALTAKMAEIDPQTPQLMTIRQEIVEQYRQAMQGEQ